MLQEKLGVEVSNNLLNDFQLNLSHLRLSNSISHILTAREFRYQEYAVQLVNRKQCQFRVQTIELARITKILVEESGVCFKVVVVLDLTTLVEGHLQMSQL